MECKQIPADATKIVVSTSIEIMYVRSLDNPCVIFVNSNAPSIDNKTTKRAKYGCPNKIEPKIMAIYTMPDKLRVNIFFIIQKFRCEVN